MVCAGSAAARMVYVWHAAGRSPGAAAARTRPSVDALARGPRAHARARRRRSPTRTWSASIRPLMSPLVWDLGHIAAFEDLWLVHRYGGRPLLREDLADVYDAFETPRAGRGDLPFLRTGEAREYLAEVRAAGARGDRAARHRRRLRARAGAPPRAAAQRDDAADDPARPARGYSPPASATATAAGPPRGPDRPGADRGPGRAVHDRRRRRAASPTTTSARGTHRLRGFQIGTPPITNASYLTFVEGGGYDRREWWSDEGWAWKEEYDITRPAGWTADLRTEWRLVGAGAAPPRSPGGPRLLVRGRRLRARARRPPPDRGRVGEGGDLGPGQQRGPPLSRGATRRPFPASTPTSTSSPAGPGRRRARRPGPRRTDAWA